MPGLSCLIHFENASRLFVAADAVDRSGTARLGRFALDRNIRPSEAYHANSEGLCDIDFLLRPVSKNIEGYLTGVEHEVYMLIPGSNTGSRVSLYPDYVGDLHATCVYSPSKNRSYIDVLLCLPWDIDYSLDIELESSMSLLLEANKYGVLFREGLERVLLWSSHPKLREEGIEYFMATGSDKYIGLITDNLFLNQLHNYGFRK
jgi:hypothetical protein